MTNEQMADGHDGQMADGQMGALQDAKLLKSILAKLVII